MKKCRGKRGAMFLCGGAIRRGQFFPWIALGSQYYEPSTICSKGSTGQQLHAPIGKVGNLLHKSIYMYKSAIVED